MLHALLEKSGGVTVAWAHLRAEASESSWSEAARSVLLFVRTEGPQSVPAIARNRGVSRQSVQALVDRLTDQGTVELQPNPAHTRSPLVQITPVGRARLDHESTREDALLRSLRPGVSDESLSAAFRTLAAVEAALERELSHRVAPGP